MKGILPAAGFATRLQLNPDESKEMLIIDGKPLIEHSLDLCKKLSVSETIVRTREEKEQLISFLNKKNVKILFQKPYPKSWQESVLEGIQDIEEGIVLLPDVTLSFEIKDLMEAIQKKYDLIVGIHEPTNKDILKLRGAVKMIEKGIEIEEKPHDISEFQFHWCFWIFSKTGKEKFKHFLWDSLDQKKTEIEGAILFVKVDSYTDHGYSS